MSLQPQSIPDVPEETRRVALAAFPKGALCLRLRDAIGTIFAVEQFADLYPRGGQPAAAPWRLTLVTILQFLEGLSDRQAALAFCSRIVWSDSVIGSGALPVMPGCLGYSARIATMRYFCQSL